MSYSTGLIRSEVSSEMSKAFKDAGEHQIALNKEYDNMSSISTNMNALKNMFNPDDDSNSDGTSPSSRNSILLASDMFLGNDDYGSDDSHNFLSSPSPDRDSSEEGSKIQEFRFEIPKSKTYKDRSYRRGVIDVLDFLQRHHFIEEFLFEGDHEEIIVITPTKGMIPFKRSKSEDSQIPMANEKDIEKEEIEKPVKSDARNTTSEHSTSIEDPKNRLKEALRKNIKDDLRSKISKNVPKKQETADDNKEGVRPTNQKEMIPSQDMTKSTKKQELSAKPPIKDGKKKEDKKAEDTHKSFNYANTFGSKVTVKTSKYCKNCKAATRKNATIYLNHLYTNHSHEIALIKSLAYPL
ncbi:phosphoprotein [Muir Springs virus]|uniref:Phosphoprotein n=1 Tax=Muir Springs virus TaxID=932700 RepID=A0A0D3R0Z3_9RHAB|nr:phosphoprotein [Muir Springs virus]AJR28339.1 phosphoprotein [Muir Springs virus]